MFLCLLRGRGATRGTGSAQDADVPLQVSVNPAYQAMELEYALRKVGSVPDLERGLLVVAVGGWGGESTHSHATPTVCPSVGCEWADAKLVCVGSGGACTCHGDGT